MFIKVKAINNELILINTAHISHIRFDSSLNHIVINMCDSEGLLIPIDEQEAERIETILKKENLYE